MTALSIAYIVRKVSKENRLLPYTHYKKKCYLMITSAEQAAHVKPFIVSLAFQTQTSRHKTGPQNNFVCGKF